MLVFLSTDKRKSLNFGYIGKELISDSFYLLPPPKLINRRLPVWSWIEIPTLQLPLILSSGLRNQVKENNFEPVKVTGSIPEAGHYRATTVRISEFLSMIKPAIGDLSVSGGEVVKTGRWDQFFPYNRNWEVSFCRWIRNSNSNSWAQLPSSKAESLPSVRHPLLLHFIPARGQQTSAPLA